jgi:hypothetical protein
MTQSSKALEQPPSCNDMVSVVKYSYDAPETVEPAGKRRISLSYINFIVSDATNLISANRLRLLPERSRLSNLVLIIIDLF